MHALELNLDFSGVLEAVCQNNENSIKFCRLLCCLKTNYQLTHIVSVPFYNEWIDMVLDFTSVAFGEVHEVRGLLCMRFGIKFRHACVAV